MCATQIGAEGEGMIPSKVADHAQGKIISLELGLRWIVMADGRDAAKKIAQRPPPLAHIFRNSTMRSDRVGEHLMDVARPLRGIRVRRVAKPRKERKFKMIMRVDESRQQKISAEIDFVRTRFVVIFMRARKNMCDPACGNLQSRLRRLMRSKNTTGAAHRDLPA